ncbi:SAM-dependent methyltransferase [Spirillospora albida]|uniref:SAM-dependent methyltransferase n=1 Tax=Spirillospora albida TaxID=58123 RepID=UPI00068BCF6B|nr:SAM-dependent methyltransferase [Spirillospora albida]
MPRFDDLHDPVPTAEAPPAEALGPEIDTTVPHSARIWNYWLGGKDHYAVDRIAGDEYKRTFPAIVDVARAQRAFLGRAVRHLAGEVGIRQFLDIGTGLPTVDNTHEVAQRVDPRCRIVYVDNDPMVLAHARALLTSTPKGATAYVDADLRDIDTILAGAEPILDLDEPVAVMLLGILGHISTTEEAREIVERLVDAVALGSYLVLADGTSTLDERSRAQDRYNNSGAAPYQLRTPDEIESILNDLELLDPGVVTPPLWRPEPLEIGTPQPVESLCGMAVIR